MAEWSNWHLVPVAPMAAPRMTQRDKWKKRPAVVKYFARRDALRIALAKHINKDYIGVDVVAHIPFPKSYSKKKRSALLAGRWHQEKPDADNILKFVCDTIFKEDKRISIMHIEKIWTNEPAGFMHIRFK